MTHPTNPTQSLLYYKKEIEQDSHSSLPTGSIDVERLLNHHHDYWIESRPSSVDTPRTLILIDWRLSVSCETYKNKLIIFLDDLLRTHRIFVWMGSHLVRLNEGNLDMFHDQYKVEKIRLSSFERIKRHAASAGITASEIGWLDTTLIDVMMSSKAHFEIDTYDLEKSNANIADVFDFLIAIKRRANIVCTHLSECHERWLADNHDTLQEYNTIAYDYLTIACNDSYQIQMCAVTNSPKGILINGRLKAFTDIDFQKVRALDFNEPQDPFLVTLLLTFCEKVEIIHFANMAFNDARYQVLSTIRFFSLHSLQVTNCEDLSVIDPFFETHLPLLKRLKINATTLTSTSTVGYQLEELELNNINVLYTILSEIISTCTHLKALKISHCHFHDTGFKRRTQIDELPKLEDLLLREVTVAPRCLMDLLYRSSHAHNISIYDLTLSGSEYFLPFLRTEQQNFKILDETKFPTPLFPQLNTLVVANAMDRLPLKLFNLSKNSTIKSLTFRLNNASDLNELENINTDNLTQLQLNESQIPIPFQTLVHVLNKTPKLENISLFLANISANDENFEEALSQNLINLTHLDLSSAKIDTCHLEYLINRMPALTSLDIRQCAQTEAHIQTEAYVPIDVDKIIQILNLSQLTYLNLSVLDLSANSLIHILNKASNLEQLQIQESEINEDYDELDDFDDTQLAKLESLGLLDSYIPIYLVGAMFQSTKVLDSVTVSSHEILDEMAKDEIFLQNVTKFEICGIENINLSTLAKIFKKMIYLEDLTITQSSFMMEESCEIMFRFNHLKHLNTLFPNSDIPEPLLEAFKNVPNLKWSSASNVYRGNPQPKRAKTDTRIQKCFDEMPVDSDTSCNQITFEVDDLLFDIHDNPVPASKCRLNVFNDLILSQDAVSKERAFTLKNKAPHDFLDKSFFIITDESLSDIASYMQSNHPHKIFYKGYTRVTMSSSWQALPSISVEDTITHIKVSTDINFKLKYCKRDDLYYIRFTSSQNDSVFIEYLIETNKPKDTNIFLPDDMCRLILDLKEYGSTTLDAPLPQYTGIEFINLLLTQRVGACRHRAVIFKYYIERYLHLPVRIIYNQCHAFVETKVQDKWVSLDLGGYPAKLKHIPRLQARPTKKATPIDKLVCAWRRQFQSGANNLLKFDDIMPTLLQSPQIKVLLQATNQNDLITTLLKIRENAQASQAPVFIVEHPDRLILQRQSIQKVLSEDKTHFVGKLQNAPSGPLYDFMQMASQNPSCIHIVVIDYSNFKPEAIVRLNCMLDGNSEIDGIKIPANIKIIGLQDIYDDKYYGGEDFFSRFDKILRPTDIPKIHALNKADDMIYPKYVINLFEKNNWRELLEGGWQLTGSQLKFRQGLLFEAFASECPVIEVLNGPQDSKAYQLFWHALAQDGAYQSFNVSEKLITHRQYYKPTNVANHYFEYLDENDWISIYSCNQQDINFLNPTAASKLFDDYEIKEGLLYQIPGKLKLAEKSIRFFLTRDLSSGQWAEIFEFCDTHNICLTIFCLPQVRIALDIINLYTINIMINPNPSSATFNEDINSPIILTSDIDYSISKLLAEGTILFDITDSSIDELFIMTKTCFDAHVNQFLFEQSKGALLSTLDSTNLRIILTGNLSMTQWERLFPYLYQYPGRICFVTSNKNIALGHLVELDMPTFEQRMALFPELQSFVSLNGNDASIKNKNNAQLKCLKAYQTIYPENTDSKAPWQGLHQLTPHIMDNKVIHLQEAAEITKHFEKTRLHSILSALKAFPLIFITGPTGVGKTTFIETQLKKELTCTFYHYEDIKAWACDLKGGLLVIDEANISPREYSEFVGLCYDHQPSILIQDNIYSLTKEHKVIFIGNPCSYGGSRKLAQLFNEHVICQEFTPLLPEVIFYKIIKPIFAKHGLDAKLDNIVHGLLDMYQWLVEEVSTDLLVTPRDIKFIVLLTLAHLDLGDMPQNSMYQIAERELMTNAFNFFNLRLNETIKAKFNYQFSMNADEMFETDLNECNFVLTPSRKPILDVINMMISVRQYKRKQWNETNKLISGDISMLVLESEPGLGKTELMKAYFKSENFISADLFNKQINLGDYYYHIPVALSLSQKKWILLKAYIEGNPVYIDELNSAPQLEQFINALLSGCIPDDPVSQEPGFDTRYARPGFLIFGTQNPIYMAGRNHSTKAQDARRITLELKPYTHDEVKTILIKKGVSDTYAEAISQAFLKEREHSLKHKLPHPPNFRDVCRLADGLMQREQPLRAQAHLLRQVSFFNQALGMLSAYQKSGASHLQASSASCEDEAEKDDTAFYASGYN